MKPSSITTVDIYAGDSLGTTSVALVRSGVIEIRYDQYTSRATAMRSFERAAELLRENPGAHALLLSLLTTVGHDPGNTALGVRWINEFREQVQRVAMLTRSQSLSTLAPIVKVMRPWLDVRVFSLRDEALTWCERAATSTSQTHVRTVGGRSNTA